MSASCVLHPRVWGGWAAVAAALALGACGGGEQPPEPPLACRPADRALPGPSDLTASMVTGVGRVQRVERVASVLVRPDGAVRLERAGREPACYRVGAATMRELNAGLSGFDRLERRFGPPNLPPGGIERTVTADGHAVRSVDAAPRPRRLERVVTALRRVEAGAPDSP